MKVNSSSDRSGQNLFGQQFRIVSINREQANLTKQIVRVIVSNLLSGFHVGPFSCAPVSVSYKGRGQGRGGS